MTPALSRAAAPASLSDAIGSWRDPTDSHGRRTGVRDMRVASPSNLALTRPAESATPPGGVFRT